LESLLQSPPAALEQEFARPVVDHEVGVDVEVAKREASPLAKSSFLAPVDHIVNVELFVPVTTRSPQTGNCADGSRP
jgi:hypothetical protein